MLMIMILMIIFIMVSMILLMLTYIISIKSFLDREKISPFECGFEPKKTSRIPFSIHFFLIAIIFIVFDIEITILLPLPISLMSTNNLMLLISSMMFILILILGLFYEWMMGSLKWIN